METIRLWAIETDSDRQALAKPVGSVKKLETEDLLEDVLTKHPELLLPGLSLVGRQTTTATGRLDLLGVDEDGRLVVFELKRGTLARDAIAQVIDYASYLAFLDIELLASHIEQHSGIAGIEKIEDFKDWYQQRFPAQPISSILPPRMVLVGLGVDEPTERMTRFLADSELDVSLITFHGFQYDGKTFLARQMRVQGTEESERLPGGSSKQAREKALRELTSHLDVSSLFDEMRSYLREKFSFASEYPGAISVSFSLLDIDEFGRQSNQIYIGLYLNKAIPNRIDFGFHERAIELIEDQFASLTDKFPNHRTGWKVHMLHVTSEAQWNLLREETDQLFPNLLDRWKRKIQP